MSNDAGIDSLAVFFFFFCGEVASLSGVRRGVGRAGPAELRSNPGSRCHRSRGGVDTVFRQDEPSGSQHFTRLKDTLRCDTPSSYLLAAHNNLSR